MGKQWKQCQTLFFGAPKSLQMVTADTKLPLRGLEGVPGLPSAPQDEAGLHEDPSLNSSPLSLTQAKLPSSSNRPGKPRNAEELCS